MTIVMIHGGGSSLIQVKKCWPNVIDRPGDKNYREIYQTRMPDKKGLNLSRRAYQSLLQKRHS